MLDNAIATRIASRFYAATKQIRKFYALLCEQDLIEPSKVESTCQLMDIWDSEVAGLLLTGMEREMGMDLLIKIKRLRGGLEWMED